MNDVPAHPDEPATLAKGDVFAGFTVERQVAHGPLGNAYLAKAAGEGGKVVILRLFSAGVTADEDYVAPYERAAHGLALMSSPHLPSIEGVGTVKGRLYIAYEHVEGQKLSELKAQPVRRALALARGCVAGLVAIHHAGQIHGRLCPERLRLRPDGTVVLTDFSVLRMSMDPRPKPDAVPVAYHSPEAAAGQPADIRGDLHAVGVLLYALLTGRPAFPGATPERVQALILSERRPSLLQSLADLNPAVDALVARCFARSPAARFQTPDELVHALTVCPVDPPPDDAAKARAAAASVLRWVVAHLRHLVLVVIVLVVALTAPKGVRWYQAQEATSRLVALDQPDLTVATADALAPELDRYAVLMGEKAPEVVRWRGIVADLRRREEQAQAAAAQAAEDAARKAAMEAAKHAAEERLRRAEQARQDLAKATAEVAAQEAERRRAIAEEQAQEAERRDRVRASFLITKIPPLISAQAPLEGQPTRRSVVPLESGLANVADLEAVFAAMDPARAKEFSAEPVWNQLQAHKRQLEKQLATARKRRDTWLESTKADDPVRIKEVAAEDEERTRLETARQADKATWTLPTP